MKELISQAEAAVTRTVTDAGAQLELLTALVVAREKIKVRFWISVRGRSCVLADWTR